ncbi:MAG: type II toxin-antitoxin system RatA family toxin [Rhizobiaceae bacterium]
MPGFYKVHTVPYTPRQMFDLVADVEAYPQFLPLCESLDVRTRRERDGKAILVADMGVGYKAIRETFTSQVLLDPQALRIDVKYLDGPFRRLDNEWRFVDDAKGGCAIHFTIDYEFSSRMLGMLMGAMFDTAFRKFTTAFEERAKHVYAGSAIPYS